MLTQGFVVQHCFGAAASPRAGKPFSLYLQDLSQRNCKGVTLRMSQGTYKSPEVSAELSRGHPLPAQPMRSGLCAIDPV